MDATTALRTHDPRSLLPHPPRSPRSPARTPGRTAAGSGTAGACRAHARWPLAAALALLAPGAVLLTATAPAAAQELPAPAYLLPFTMRRFELPNPCHTVASAAALTAPRLEVFVHVPSARPAGVVYFFHGGDGSASNWRVREEMAALLDDCVRAGFGVVVTESTHRGGPGQPDVRNWIYANKHAEMGAPSLGAAWLDDTVNADEAHIRNVHRELVGHGLVTPWASAAAPGTPVYLVGFSSGGKMAAALGYLLRLPPPSDLAEQSPRVDDPADPRRVNVRGVAAYCSVGSGYYFAGPAPLGTYPTPVIFNHASNDASALAADVIQHHALLEATTAGTVDVVRNEHTPMRLRADRMTRVAGLSYSDSRAIYHDLLAQGLLDPLTGVPLARASARALSPALRQRLDAYARLDGFDTREDRIDRQLSVLRAEHQVMSNLHGATIRLFKANP